MHILHRSMKPNILNLDKVAYKKAEATERSRNVNVSMKYNNLVMEFTPAPYELFRQGIKSYFQNVKDKDIKISTKSDLKGAVVHESLSVLTKETGTKTIHDKYVPYHIKGYSEWVSAESFIEDDLNIILEKLESQTGLYTVNVQIKDI